VDVRERFGLLVAAGESVEFDSLVDSWPVDVVPV